MNDRTFRLLAESIQDYAIILLDVSGRISTWNAGARRIKGYEESEILGQSFIVLYTPEDQAAGRPLQLLSEAAQNGRIEDESWRVRKDGSRFWANVTITAIHGADGKIEGFGKVTRDLTAQRQAREALQAEVMERRRLEEELRKINRSLETIVAERTSQLLRTHESLKQAQSELRELAEAAQHAREQEKGRFARELHDEMGQLLSGLKMTLHQVRKKIRQGLAAEDLDSMDSMLDATVVSMRRIASDLRPTVLDEGELAAAIKWLVNDFRKRSGLNCRLQIIPIDLDLTEPYATAAYRIVQESLTNVAKHAEASSVDVVVMHTQGEVCVETHDDGKGFDVDAPRRQDTFGLMGIRERVYFLNGALSLKSRPGDGTNLRACIPVTQ